MRAVSADGRVEPETRIFTAVQIEHIVTSL
jgi:hypothetical protein